MFDSLFVIAIFLVFGVPATIVWLGTFVVIAKEEHVRVVETFGKFSSVRPAGLSLKLPWPIQSAGKNFSLQQLQLSESVGVKSVDNAFIDVPIKLQYRVNPELAREAYYKLNNPEAQIRSYIVNQVRSTAGGLSFEELFRSRDVFEADVEQTLKEKMTEYGYTIVNVLVDDPQPSKDLREAFDRVIASKRLREAAENEGEAARILSVAKAAAEGEALEIKGNAYAKFRKTIAEGNAEALNKFAGETGLTANDGLAFFNSVNEMEAIRDAAESGGKVVFIAGSAGNVGTNGVMGLVAAQDDKFGKSDQGAAEKNANLKKTDEAPASKSGKSK